MTTKRDPKMDPQPGDFLSKVSSTNRRMTRRVTVRAGNDIKYCDHNGKEKICWISTWMDWAREAEVEA